ncbi:nucleotidyl transferase AbiEii/AbiGii toxin family protein [Aquiflexum sp. LQ15W]|uniref:nucleotidyl transferase AbiEii/AbiGii toxin family protein n=1 Tax=Cognataquiflexum nitidum TaxID=2922272 RepID=UPI001F147E1D|nr:nucleotidyl transferase AbiEii/AbiGii toxin family protein [Cognataquiflexum nitidum]MCH6201692.1 nucleotidyl transferase AbiEii/AbiGii toxin family protein [Cognataquiflexum nitidum]
MMKIPELKGFSLVGGTALSLLYGHRISVDLDLFSNEKFDNIIVNEALVREFGSDFLVEEKPPHFGIFCYIQDIKVDFIRHPHPIIRPIKEIEGIRFFSNEDIIAMKVQAILGRGKKKDFWDIAELLKHYSVSDFVKFHKEKYNTKNLLITVPEVITYFGDGEESEDPVSLKGQTWNSVQKEIKKKVSEYLI